MYKKEILDAIAPCSLCCYTCGAKKDGAISKYSKILLDYHKGYYQFKSRLPLKHKKQILKEDKRFLQELEKRQMVGVMVAEMVSIVNIALKVVLFWNVQKLKA